MNHWEPRKNRSNKKLGWRTRTSEKDEIFLAWLVKTKGTPKKRKTQKGELILGKKLGVK